MNQAQHIARLAVASLHAELSLYPKPGLVSPVDNGSHRDMNSATFMRSLFALRHYFVRITKAGMVLAPFDTLQTLALEAEQRMLTATGGVNTHRGAIFTLGLLCAASGACYAHGETLTAVSIRRALQTHWGTALQHHTYSTQETQAPSHGQLVASRHAISGAREEAALGFPSIFTLALPSLQASLAAHHQPRMARIDALFALMAAMHDTNVYYRGGPAAAALVRQHAQGFLDAGGTAQPDWLARAEAIHHTFVAHSISPGGAADLLAATCLLQAIEQLTLASFTTARTNALTNALTTTMVTAVTAVTAAAATTTAATGAATQHYRH